MDLTVTKMTEALEGRSKENETLQDKVKELERLNTEYNTKLDELGIKNDWLYSEQYKMYDEIKLLNGQIDKLQQEALNKDKQILQLQNVEEQ